MTAAPGEHLEPLRPLIGHWQSSGTVFGEDGAATGQIAGTDTYSWAPGGHWVLHEVDVTMDGERTQLLELIGGRGGADGWQMHAFGAADSPEVMRLTLEDDGLLLLQGAGVRSWFRPGAGPDHMTTLWEREVNDQWVAWMDMRFDRNRSGRDQSVVQRTTADCKGSGDEHQRLV